MRTKYVAAGLIVLVVGIALIAVGASSLLANATTFKTFSQPSAGEFVSGEIVLNTTSLVEVRSPATTGGLIPASDLTKVSESNITTYAIPYNSTVAGTDVYRSLHGSYYYVAFSSTAPSSSVVAAGTGSRLARYGLLAVIGFVCLIAGIVIAIVGAVKKGNKKSGTMSESEYYAKRGSEAPSAPAS